MKDVNANLLRHSQRELLQNDIDTSNAMLPHAKPDEKGIILASRERIKKQLEAGSPTPLTGAEKDQLAGLEKKLLARITNNMPTEEVMRKNNPGAVDWHMKWEKHNKKLVRMWKNVTIQLNPDNSDRDLTNIERFRPSGQTDRMRTDAQIPGLMSYGSVPEENWPFDAPENTAAKQAQRTYDAQTAENDINAACEEFDKEEAKEEGKERTPEQRLVLLSNLAKGREVLAAKRAADKQIEEALDQPPMPVEDTTIVTQVTT